MRDVMEDERVMAAPRSRALRGLQLWGGPKACRLGYHQLGGALINSDTCNAARAAERLIMAAAAEAIEGDIGAVAWAALSEDEKVAKTRMYVGDCMQQVECSAFAAMDSRSPT